MVESVRPPVMTVQEVGQQLLVSDSTVHRLVRAGMLEAIKWGTQRRQTTRIKRASFELFLSQGCPTL